MLFWFFFWLIIIVWILPETVLRILLVTVRKMGIWWFTKLVLKVRFDDCRSKVSGSVWHLNRAGLAIHGN